MARSYVWRWAIILTATVVAFWQTWANVIAEARAGAAVGYYGIVIVLAVVAAAGLARKPHRQLQIFDKQADAITGVLALVISILVKALVVPRYSEQYQVLHLDVLAAGVFLAGCTALMFGLRPFGRFWPAWALLLACGPLTYRSLVVIFGGTSWSAGVVVTLFSAAAVAIAFALTVREAAVIGATVVGLGGLTVLLLSWLAPGAPLFVSQAVPSVTASVATILLVRAHRRRQGANRYTRGPAPVPSGTWRTAVTCIVAGVLAGLVSLPERSPAIVAAGPPLTGSPALDVPAGWFETARTDYPWVRRYFGPTATLTRQYLSAQPSNEAVAAFADSVLAEPGVLEFLSGQSVEPPHTARTIVIDTFTHPHPAQLDVYPDATLYDMHKARRSEPRIVSLGHGVIGTLSTLIDETAYLTETMLVFSWQRGDEAQRVVIIAVDNPEPDAMFSEPQPSMASNMRTLIEVLFRGNTAIADITPEFKDAELVTTAGRQIVAAQFGEEP